MRLSRNRNWGNPGADLAAGAAVVQSAEGCRLARTAGGRHVATTRRPDADRTRQSSDRARRRHLADADAQPHAARATSARRCRPSTMVAARPARHRPKSVDPETSLRDPCCRGGARGGAYLRQRRDQKGVMPRKPPATAAWLSKVRPMYGHDYHFHVRIKCPAGNPGCTLRRRGRIPTAAAMNSTIGSAMRCCIRSRRPHRRNRGRR